MPLPLEATFGLTPRESYFYVAEDQRAVLAIQGAYFSPKYYEGYRYSFDGQHAEDKLYFPRYNAADPGLDYTVWDNRRMVPYIRLDYNLSSLGTHKELALIFGFQAVSESRLLIFTDDGLLSDETLVPGDNQFLMEVETIDSLDLHFIHARRDGSIYGGDWFFKGITGYVV